MKPISTDLVKIRNLCDLDELLNLTSDTNSYEEIVAVLKPLFDEACIEAANAASLRHHIKNVYGV